MRNASLTSTHFIGWLLVLTLGVGIGALAQDDSDLRQALNDAYEEGYAKGYEEGYAKGYEEGYAKGRATTTMEVEERNLDEALPE